MRRTALALLLLAACSKPEDEAARRAREAREIEKKLGDTRITLYRVLKTALRSLPPRDAVRAAAGDAKELTRAEWQAILEKDPALAPHKNRVGLFIVAIHLREALVKGTVALLAVAAAKSGGRLAGDAPLTIDLPQTAAPFGGPVDFIRECKDVLADDEDNHPTLAWGLMTKGLQTQIREAAPTIAGRLTLPAFEHLVLGLAWFKLKPEFALYELHRCDPATLASPESPCACVVRAWIYTENEWHVHSLDELARIEETTGPAAALKHSLRHRNYVALGRKEEAKKELELARAAAGDKPELAAAAHLFAAKALIDDGQYKKAATEVRSAAELLPEDKRVEALAIAEKLEKELPESTAPHHLIVWATGLLLRSAADEAVDPKLVEWGGDVRDRAHERVDAWEKEFPSAGDLKDKAGDLWKKVRR